MSGFEGRDPYEDYLVINKELENFNPKILQKPQIILANKMDIQNSEENLKIFKSKLKNTEVYPISGVTGVGINEVVNKLADMLDNIKKQPLYEEEKFESHILYKFEREQPFTITNENNVWVIRGKEIEKILRMTKFQTDESVMRFANKLRKLGIDDKLRELGANDGDTVRILDFEFEYKL